MDSQRAALYSHLASEIGHTPLYEISRIELPGGNRVFAKEENRNPGGSHYDRVFLPLFRHFEEQGKIVPGHTPVVETSSGSAGVSFARLARLLGYEALVICPADLPPTRIAAVREQGAEVRLSPAGEYVNGSARELARIFQVENKERKARGQVPYFGLNHTQGEAAAISARSVEGVIDEAVEQAAADYGVSFDLAVAAVGNGTTLLGFGKAARRNNLPLVVWEALNSGRLYDLQFGQGAFAREYGQPPATAHTLYGTIFGATPYPLLNIDQAFSEDLVETVRILSDDATKQTALEVTTNESHRSNIVKLPTWNRALALLRDVEGKPVGRSSAGNLAMILNENWQLRGLNILTFFYDDLSRY